MTDEALLARLAMTGRYDADGVHRGARLEPCRSCRAVVLVGLDADRAAIVATTDPHEIDEFGETVAIRLGLPTYSLVHGFSVSGNRQWFLDTRMQCQIEAPRSTAVVAAHRCGLQIPPAAVPFLSGRPGRRRPAAGGSGPDAPPF